MIPVPQRRAAERRLLEAKIAATPSPARFRTHSLPVLFVDPAKAREMKAAGFGTGWSGECWLVLPLADRRPPEAEKETIEIEDWGGQTTAFTVALVTPLLAENCFRLTLRARPTRPARSATPGAAA